MFQGGDSLETGSYHMADAGFKLLILLPLPLKGWDYRFVFKQQHKIENVSFNLGELR